MRRGRVWHETQRKKVLPKGRRINAGKLQCCMS